MTVLERPGGNAGPTSKAAEAREVTEHALKALGDQLDRGNSARLDAFLASMGKFHRYSFGNVMLIMAQRPDASRIAGFHTWKSLGRSVRKGEKGIMIIAPMTLRAKEGDGPEQQDTRPIVRFRVAHVFDISQTEGEPLPDLDRVQGDPGAALIRLESAVRAAGITLEDADDLGGADGLSKGGAIVLRSGLPPAERFSVLAHEWAHELLHRSDDRPAKEVRETEAEAVAFVVSHAVGLEARSASADYIRLYNGDTKMLSSSLDRIQKAACIIIEAIHGDEEQKAVARDTQRQR